jgi:hypothetical protein
VARRASGELWLGLEVLLAEAIAFGPVGDRR